MIRATKEFCRIRLDKHTHQIPSSLDTDGVVLAAMILLIASCVLSADFLAMRTTYVSRYTVPKLPSCRWGANVQLTSFLLCGSCNTLPVCRHDAGHLGLAHQGYGVE